jgi:hypothetical protein
VTWYSLPGFVVTSIVPSGKKVIAQGSSKEVITLAWIIEPLLPGISNSAALAGGNAVMMLPMTANAIRKANMRIGLLFVCDNLENGFSPLNAPDGKSVDAT